MEVTIGLRLAAYPEWQKKALKSCDIVRRYAESQFTVGLCHETGACVKQHRACHGR